METAPTPHEARARNAKAQRLAAVLMAHGATVAALTALEAHPELAKSFWGMTADLAGCHAPHSQATVDAVARILVDLIAHRDEQEAIAEVVAPRATVGMLDEPTVYTRTARDSQGYRAQMARIAPQPETTEADLFAPFGQAVNR